MRISAAVINWNNNDTIVPCITSLLAQQGVELDPVLLDNGSTDGSLELVRRCFPSLHIIENGANLGFAVAHNIGFRQTEGDWHLVLNSDVVLDPNYVRELLTAANDPFVGAVSGKLLRFDQRDGRDIIDSAGIEIFASRRVWDRGTGQIDAGQFDHVQEVFGCCAAAALYRRSCMLQIAPDGRVFAEIYFAYYEDVDLAWRMLSHGWRSLYVPSAVGRHARGGSTSGSAVTRRLVFRNRYVLLVRNDRILDLVFSSLPVLAVEVMQLARILRHPSLAREIIALPRLLFKACRERRQMRRAGRNFGLARFRKLVTRGTGIRGWVRQGGG